MAKKGQSNRLSKQQKEGQGPVSIFHADAIIHDKEVNNTSIKTMNILKTYYPTLEFRYRKNLLKKEINEALNKIDNYLGQTLFVDNAQIIPDGGLIEVKDDDGKWHVILVSEAKHQGKDIENIQKGVLVGKKKNQDTMVAGNAIERAYYSVLYDLMFEAEYVSKEVDKNTMVSDKEMDKKYSEYLIGKKFSQAFDIGEKYQEYLIKVSKGI